MLLVLGLVVGILWWVVSDPAGRGESGPVPPSPTVGAERPHDVEPPATLGKDEVWLADLELDAGTVMTESSTLRDVRSVGQGVSTGPDGLVAAQLVVDATVPFAVVADELGNGTVVSDADVVRKLVTIEHDIEGLPEGLVLQSVTVQSDGFRANFVGENVKIVP
nr:hypothetical protein [Arthrobacter roseus]